ncbi:MAG: hypothetical protein H7Z42_19520 [Roseiflexaceae bacterium]|nr:hypothetical protein [Roseiflexaceae bacterium]
MLLLAFAPPLFTAVLCLGLNRVVATRALGFGAALALLASAALLLVATMRGAVLFERPWMQLNGPPIQLSLALDAASLPAALLVATGGAVCLLALALALPPKLRGFGGLIASLLLLLTTTLLGLALREVLLLPLVWAALPLLGFVTHRASGGQADAQILPAGMLANLLGAIVLLGAGLSAQSGAAEAVAPQIGLVGLFVAGLIALGLPPFHRVVHDLVDAPAAVAAPILAFGLPLLAGFTLTRVVAQMPLTESWRAALEVAGVGAVALCAAGALGETRLRRLVGWQTSAQFGLLLIALGQAPAVLAVLAPALLVQAALVSCAAMLAVGVIERRAGTDDMREMRPGAALLVPGAALLLAAASAAGVPGTWGFWSLRWLFDELRTSTPLLIGPLLAASSLLALAWMTPLATFLRSSRAPAALPRSNLISLLCPLLVALPLVLFGIAPQLAWNSWGMQARGALLPLAPANLPDPALPSTPGMAASAVAIGALICTVWLRSRSVRRILADDEIEPSGVLTANLLGESLRPLSWLGAPSSLFGWLWQRMIAASRTLGWLLSFLEQRYFMAGLMLAVVVVILLLIRG